LFVTELDLDSNSLSKAITKIYFYRIRGDVHQTTRIKRSLEVFYAPLVRFVCFLSAHGRLGMVLQENIRPLPVSQGLALSHDFKEIVVSRLKSFSQLLACFLPIGGEAGLSSGNTFAIPIANPPV
jgi:hypothetical protein